MQGAQQTFTTVRTVGTVVQSGISSELGGGDFGDGLIAGLGSVAGQAANSGVAGALGASEVMSPDVSRFVGGVVGAGVGATVVDTLGGDGDQTFLNNMVNLAVSYAPPLPQPEPGRAADERNGSDVESDAAAPVEVPGRAPDIGDGPAPATPAPASQPTNGVDAPPSVDEPPQEATPPDVELPWIPLAPIDMFVGANASTLSDSTDNSAGGSDSERAAAERAAALQAFRQSEIAQQNDAAGARSDLTPDSSAHQVHRGDSVERIAREHYGENWRAGQAAIMVVNGLRTNAEGSPLIRDGQSLALPDLAPVSEDQLRGLNRAGGRITANNTVGLENARFEREAAANQAELARLANRSTSSSSGDATVPQGMGPDEAYRVYMGYGGRSGADPVTFGANAAADPAAINYGDAATAMNGSGVPSGGQRLSEVLPNMGPGFFGQRYSEAVAGFANSNNSLGERLGYLGLGTAMSPMMLLEEGGRGLINAPRQLVSGAENAAAVFTAPTAEDAIAAGLTAVRDLSFGIVGLAPLVPASRMTGPLMQTPEELAVRAFPGAEASAASRATYATASTQIAPAVALADGTGGVNALRGTAASYSASFGTAELDALRTAGLSEVEIARQVSLNGDVFLFRGTSPGWAGSPGAQATAVSATTDPYIATVFALEARGQSGQAIVQFGPRTSIGTFDVGNWMAAQEREVGVLMTATEFAERAPNAVSADVARRVLAEMGLPDLPSTVASPSARSMLLDAAPRMTPEQIAEFLRRIINERP